MLKQTLNKGISIPIATGVILIIAIIAGGVIYWQYNNLPEIPEVGFSEKETPKEDLIEGTGTIQYIDLEGGFYGIVSDDGESYEVKDIPSEYLEDGLMVKFVAKKSETQASIYQWGIIIEIIEIEINTPECDKIQYHIDRYSCYESIAKEREDSSVCDKIQNQDVREDCYWEVAKLKKDPSICDKILDRNDCKGCIKDQCYKYVAKAKQDPLICDKIQNQDWKTSCYWSVAIEKQDSSVCKKISFQPDRDSCYSAIARKKQDDSVCDKIFGYFEKRGCYHDIAVTKQDPLICDKIQDRDYPDRIKDKNYCYLVVAELSQDLYLCDRIEELTYKNYCFLYIAVLEKDISICDKIQDQDRKNICHLFCVGEDEITDFLEEIKEEIGIELKEDMEFEWWDGDGYKVTGKGITKEDLSENLIKINNFLTSKEFYLIPCIPQSSIWQKGRILCNGVFNNIQGTDYFSCGLLPDDYKLPTSPDNFRYPILPMCQ